MALVVEDGTGLSNAESYATVNEILTYLAKVYGAGTPFSTASLEQQEQAARRATQYLQAAYGARFAGTPQRVGQRLSFPVYGGTSPELVPTAVKEAQAEAANRAITASLMGDFTPGGAVLEEEVEVGPVRRKVRFAGPTDPLPAYPLIEGLLAPLFGPYAGRMFRT